MKAIITITFQVSVLILMSLIHLFSVTEMEALKETLTQNITEALTTNDYEYNGLPVKRANLLSPPPPPPSSSSSSTSRLAANVVRLLKVENQKLKDQLRNAHNTIQQLRGSPGTETATTKEDQQQEKNCALLFFGVPRMFRQVALPSIRHHLLAPNKGCDVFVHSYNINYLTSLNDRNIDENGYPLVPTDLYDLTPNVVLESLETFYAKRNDLSFFRQNHHNDWGKTIDSTDNMVKAWHSIEGVWNLMEEYQSKNKVEYTRIGIFRMDMYYPHPIYIKDSSEPAVIPAFGWDNTMIKFCYPGFMLNDRGFYGNYEYAKIWATERFDFVKSYYHVMQEQQQQLEQDLGEQEQEERQPISRPITWSNGLEGIHSESFLFEMMKQYRVPIVEKDICFWRLRANGVIKSGDCGGHSSLQNHYLEEEDNFNYQTLKDYSCQGPRFESPVGPCTT